MEGLGSFSFTSKSCRRARSRSISLRDVLDGGHLELLGGTRLLQCGWQGAEVMLSIDTAAPMLLACAAGPAVIAFHTVEPTEVASALDLTSFCTWLRRWWSLLFCQRRRGETLKSCEHGGSQQSQVMPLLAVKRLKQSMLTILHVKLMDSIETKDRESRYLALLILRLSGVQKEFSEPS